MGKGKGRLVGKGRLADAAILQRKKYYGLAIRRNCSTSVLIIYTSIWAEFWPRFGVTLAHDGGWAKVTPNYYFSIFRVVKCFLDKS